LLDILNWSTILLTLNLQLPDCLPGRVEKEEEESPQDSSSTARVSVQHKPQTVNLFFYLVAG
jgi:hypothetical protein